MNSEVLNPSISVYNVKFILERINAYSRVPYHRGEMKVSAYTPEDAVHQTRTFLQYTTGLIADEVLYPFTYPDEDGRKIVILEPLYDVSVSGPANIRKTTLPIQAVIEASENK